MTRDQWEPVTSARHQPRAECVQVPSTDKTPVLLVQPVVKMPFMYHCHTRPDIPKANEANFSAPF
jgi:hypothetical protein